MARYGRLLTGAQWEKIGPLLPKRRNRPKGEDLPRTTAKCWKAFCGFCAAPLAGRICPRYSPHRPPAGGGFETGKGKGSGSPFGAHSWRN